MSPRRQILKLKLAAMLGLNASPFSPIAATSKSKCLKSKRSWIIEVGPGTPLAHDQPSFGRTLLTKDFVGESRILHGASRYYATDHRRLIRPILPWSPVATRSVPVS
jgi:hypothetical protein